MKRGKKAQVTLFIIIALVIIGFIGGYFLMKNFTKGPSFEDMSFNEQTEVVQESIGECFDSAYKDSLILVGAQGGYYREPFGYYIYYSGVFFPIYSLNSVNTVPSKDFIESELRLAADDSVDACLNIAKNQFPMINIEYRNYSTTVTILDDSVKFNTQIELSLTSKEGVSSTQLTIPEKEIDSDLDKMIKFADYYISSQITNPDSICMDCITEIAETYDLKIEILNFMEDTMVISTYSQDDSKIPFEFSFLEVYTGTEEFNPQLMYNQEIQEEILKETEITNEEYNEAINKQEQEIPSPPSL